jgi:hypothetical protein
VKKLFLLIKITKIMLTLFISILIQWGIITTPADFNQLTPSQQEQYIQKIVEDNLDGI